MVRYNNLSILRGFDLDNIPLIRLVMHCLASSTHPPYPYLNAGTIKSFDLPSTYEVPVNRIIQSIASQAIDGDYILLKKAIERFVEMRERGKVEISRAVEELEELASEIVLRSPSAQWQEYEKAWKRFEKMAVSSEEVEGQEKGRVLRKRKKIPSDESESEWFNDEENG